MADQLGPVEIDCDAPPYPVVRACERLGFRSPLDVRWCRVVHDRGPAPWRQLLCQPWRWLSGAWRPRGKPCPCGGPAPALERCTFALASRRVTYLVGQCPRCRTIFWDEAGGGTAGDPSRPGPSDDSGYAP